VSAIAPLLIFLALLYPLAGMRRWLQQHVFKVGWLLTKNIQTTTILFYTLFLPGVILQQFILWMAAGILNVRAERAIEWPKAQEIAELRLNFVKLGRNASGLRLAVINLMPFVIGSAIIYFVANNVLNVDEAWETFSSTGLSGFTTAIGEILSAGDVFLWIYLLFAIGNTIMPRWADLKGARILLYPLAAIVLVLLVLGVADDVVNNGILVPLGDILGLLSWIFAVIIGVNIVMTGVLGAIESVFERITGDSATFEKGKLVAMTRAERLEYERQQAEKEAKARKAARERKPAIATGPPSIYRLPLPTPGAPTRADEPVIVRREDERGLPAGSTASPIQQPLIGAPAASSASAAPAGTGSSAPQPPSSGPIITSGLRPAAPAPPAAGTAPSTLSGASSFTPAPKPTLSPPPLMDDEDEEDLDEDELDEDELLDDEDEDMDEEA
jgi:hypothetical protein